VGTVDFLTLLNNVLVLREAELSYEEQLSGSIIPERRSSEGKSCSPSAVPT